MISFTKKERIVILILSVVILGIVVYNILNDRPVEIVNENDIQNEDISIEYEDEKQENENYNELSSNNEKEQEKFIFIDICGEVKNPGVYKLQKDARVIDAIDMAGGLTQNADLKSINRSKKLRDEQKIYVYKIGEIQENNLAKGQVVANQESSNSEISNDKININTASKDMLISLHGIGEVKASRIIEYRRKHKFETIDEIVNISGIGSKTFSKIKDKIIAK